MNNIKPLCPYCLNATINPNLTPADDLSYMPMRTGAGKPTIIEFQGIPEGQMYYIPKYCPECGRRLIENARYRND